MTTSPDLSYLLSLPVFDYFEPKTVKEACLLLSERGERAKLMAGGTDLLVSMRKREQSPQFIVNLKKIPNLSYIHHSDKEGLRIGALTTLSEVENSPLVREKFPMVAQAAHAIGSPHIRNMGTIGGNLCNAAPSADTAPALIALGANVRVEGVDGARTVPLEEFFIGPGQTVLQSDEIVTEVQVPNPEAHTGGAYVKLPARTAKDIALVGVAALVILDWAHSNIVDAKIVLGAVAPTPMRANKAEAALKEKAVDSQFVEQAAQIAAEESKPISDVRGSAYYRREMVRVLTKRAITEAISQLYPEFFAGG